MVDSITSNPKRNDRIVREDGLPAKQTIDWFDDIELKINELVKQANTPPPPPPPPPPPASFRGALVYRDTDFPIISESSTTLLWNLEDYDTGNIHDNNVNSGRLTVPPGVSAVILSSAIEWEFNAGGTRLVQIRKNNGSFRGAGTDDLVPTVLIINRQELVTAPIMVVPGDYFTVIAIQTSGGNLNINQGFGIHTWFAMQIIE